jgi:hypothetical protein
MRSFKGGGPFTLLSRPRIFSLHTPGYGVPFQPAARCGWRGPAKSVMTSSSTMLGSRPMKRLATGTAAQSQSILECMWRSVEAIMRVEANQSVSRERHLRGLHALPHRCPARSLIRLQGSRRLRPAISANNVCRFRRRSSFRQALESWWEPERNYPSAVSEVNDVSDPSDAHHAMALETQVQPPRHLGAYTDRLEFRSAGTRSPVSSAHN